MKWTPTSVGVVVRAGRICLEAFGSVRASGVHASRCAASSSEVLGTRSLRSRLWAALTLARKVPA